MQTSAMKACFQIAECSFSSTNISKKIGIPSEKHILYNYLTYSKTLVCPTIVMSQFIKSDSNNLQNVIPTKA